MTALTFKQGVKVKAALAYIHAIGGDAQAVNRQAGSLIASGHDTRKAYELALNAYAGNDPDAGQAIAQLTRLVQASDDGTVQQYGAALDHYDQTGDESALNALAPMVAEDTAALEAQEVVGTEAAPSQAFTFHNTPANAPAAPTLAPPQSGRAADSFVNGSQQGAVGVMGYRAPKSGEALARSVGLPMAFVNAQQAEG